MVAQAKEIARRCVEPPLKKKPKDPPFKPSPSLEKTALFLIDCIKRLPTEKCQFCKEICFHKNPKVIFFQSGLHLLLYKYFSFLNKMKSPLNMLREFIVVTFFIKDVY